jgi:hypothetical protein
VSPSLETVFAGRLHTIEQLLEDLAERMAKLEYAIHGQAQEVGVQQQALERQTRYSAMQLAIQARGPGVTADDTIAAAEAFLVWLRTVSPG